MKISPSSFFRAIRPPSAAPTLCRSSSLPPPVLASLGRLAIAVVRPHTRHTAAASYSSVAFKPNSFLEKKMNAAVKRASTIFSSTNLGLNSSGYQNQQTRGIRVFVKDGNLEQALAFMQRKMTWSGIERMIKREQTRHLKNSEKRVLARKALERRVQAQDLARKLQSILLKKVRGL